MVYFFIASSVAGYFGNLDKVLRMLDWWFLKNLNLQSEL